MSYPPLYKDVGKKANDLINKGFVSTDKYQWKLEVDATSDNGVQFLPSLTHTTSGSLDGELKSKFRANNFSFTTSGNLKQELSLEATADKPYRGVKPTLTLSTFAENPFERTKLKLQTEVRPQYGNLTATLDLPLARFLKEVTFKTEQPKLIVSSVVGHRDYGVSVGGEVDVSAETLQVNSLNTVLTYAARNLEFTAFSKRRGANHTVGLNFYQTLLTSNLRDASVGAELVHDFQQDKPPTLTIAGTTKPDETSTVKGRVNSRGLVGLSYTQSFRGPFTFTFGADVNVLNQQEPLQWGVKLAVK